MDNKVATVGGGMAFSLKRQMLLEAGTIVTDPKSEFANWTKIIENHEKGKKRY